MPSKYELPFYIDGTMRGTFRSCQRKFYNAYVMRRVTPHASIHLHAGKAYAKACEETRVARYERGLSWPDAIDAGQIALFRAWAEHHEDEPVDPQGSGKSLENMLYLHYEYFKHYDLAGSDLTPLVLNSGKAAVEFSFAIPIEGTKHPITGEPILYVGRLDMLGIREGVVDQAWAVDEKTTAQLGPKWGTQWELRGQFIGYTWAVNCYGYHCPGAVVRGCKITPTGAIGFAEIPIQVRKHLIEKWHKELVRDCKAIVDCWLNDEWSFDFADACSAYGGCPYQIACGSKDPDKWIEYNFVPNEWNPVTGEGTLDNLLPEIPKGKDIV